MAKVLDVERSFEPRGKESTKGRNERGEGCHDENMKLKWSVWDARRRVTEL